MTNAHLQGSGVLRALLKLGNGVVGLGSDDDGALEVPTLSWGPRSAQERTAAKVGLRCSLLKVRQAGQSLSPRFHKDATKDCQLRIDSNHQHELVVVRAKQRDA